MRTVRTDLLCLAVLGFAGCTPAPTYDLVLAGGRVMDPASGLDSVRYVGILGDRIAAVSASPLRGTQIVDVTGLVIYFTVAFFILRGTLL